MEKAGNTEATTGITPTEAAIGLGFCSLDAMLTIDEKVDLDRDIAKLQQARTVNSEGFEAKIGTVVSENDPEPLDRLDELMAKMSTPEHRAAVDAFLTATTDEISRGSASSRNRRYDS